MLRAEGGGEVEAAQRPARRAMGQVGGDRGGMRDAGRRASPRAAREARGRRAGGRYRIFMTRCLAEPRGEAIGVVEIRGRRADERAPNSTSSRPSPRSPRTGRGHSEHRVGTEMVAPSAHQVKIILDPDVGRRRDHLRSAMPCDGRRSHRPPTHRTARNSIRCKRLHPRVAEMPRSRSWSTARRARACASTNGRDREPSAGSGDAKEKLTSRAQSERRGAVDIDPTLNRRSTAGGRGAG